MPAYEIYVHCSDCGGEDPLLMKIHLDEGPDRKQSIVGSVNDRAAVELLLAPFVLAPANSLITIVVLEPIHLPLRVVLISSTDCQCAGGGARSEFTAGNRYT